MKLDEKYDKENFYLNLSNLLMTKGGKDCEKIVKQSVRILCEMRHIGYLSLTL